MSKNFRLVFMGLLTAQALVLYVIESMIPLPFFAPGAKLGLTNLVTVIALYMFQRKRDVFLIIFMRLLLSSLFSGSMSTFLFSVAGATLSFLVMVVVKEFGKNSVSILGVSASGAVFHNVGQLTVASFVLSTPSLFLYLPILTFTGIGTGIFIGITANYIVAHMSKLKYFDFNF